MDAASRQRQGAKKSSSRETPPMTQPTAVASEASAGAELSAVELDQLLLDRRWIAVDRAPGYAMYDWLPSAPDANHEITYLIVDMTGDCRLPPYRVSLVGGDRITYHIASALVADLDMIEARRCAGCKPDRC